MIYQILFKVTYRSFYIKEACPNYGQECTMFSRMIHSLTFKEHSCTKVSESSLLIPQFDRSRNSSFLFHKLDFQECHVFSIISFPIHIAGQNFQEHRGTPMLVFAIVCSTWYLLISPKQPLQKPGTRWKPVDASAVFFFRGNFTRR